MHDVYSIKEFQAYTMLKNCVSFASIILYTSTLRYAQSYASIIRQGLLIVSEFKLLSAMAEDDIRSLGWSDNNSAWH